MKSQRRRKTFQLKTLRKLEAAITEHITRRAARRAGGSGVTAAARSWRGVGGWVGGGVGGGVAVWGV